MAKEAHYRFEVKIISRGKNARSVVAKAAYRSGSKLRDEQTGRTYNYTSRSQDIHSSVILAPPAAPEWMRQEETLWNGVEAVSTRSNARMAREFLPSLPTQLTEAQGETMLHDWAQKELVGVGMVAQISIHRSKDGNNPHAHILCTTRAIEGEGFGQVAREWNDVTLLTHLRESYADAVNAALEAAGREERVDHRSLEDRGIDREPEPKIGVAATAMKRRGVEADPERVKASRWTRFDNQIRSAVRSIRGGGEVAQYGAGVTWWERAQAAFDVVAEKGMEYLRDESSGRPAAPSASPDPAPAPSTYWQDLINAQREQQSERGSPEPEFG